MAEDPTAPLPGDRPLSALPCFLGFFWMLWEPRKRTWHDIVANSLVVRASVYPPGEFARPAR